MRFTRAKISQRQRDKAKQDKKVKLGVPITVEFREEVKSVLRGESEIVLIKGK